MLLVLMFSLLQLSADLDRLLGCDVGLDWISELGRRLSRGHNEFVEFDGMSIMTV